MADKLFTIKNKIPELSYAFTSNGIELPVLEITHDAGMLAALRISTNIKPRLLGIKGLKNIVDNYKWRIESTVEGNPRYLIFALKKV